MVSSTSAFLLGVVEKQRLATAACRLERHAVRPRACRNIVSYPQLAKEKGKFGRFSVGRSVVLAWRRLKALGKEFDVVELLDFDCESLGEVRDHKSGASALL